MNGIQQHTFHIPVMGLGYTVDTPLKVARFGISSVVSIIEDELIEKMRQFHCGREGEDYKKIDDHDPDKRAKRITAYLNLMNRIVKKQILEIRHLPFEPDNNLTKYFELLPDSSEVKLEYQRTLKMNEGIDKYIAQNQMRQQIRPGSIDVNIMSKLDKRNYDKNGDALPEEFSDAKAALRGFANSELNSSVVFSAGYNPGLYAYVEQFKDFFPDADSALKKRVILKVSDFRSANIQGKLFAKKGVWVSEFRIESGLNCGGHAFATEGLLLGPILEEFKVKKKQLAEELFEICNRVLANKGLNLFDQMPELKITVQGGIGTAKENQFLLDYYKVSSTGWGSPFLLVPEATNVDDHTLNQLATAKPDDYYMSQSSPLGITFNNFKPSSSEQQRQLRIAKHRPGSPCYKKYLASNTEFTAQPICTASREYQNLKLKELDTKTMSAEEYKQEYEDITMKDCLCEGLGAGALIKNNLEPDHKLTAVAICPGPNLAFFSQVFSLRQMVDHIYGRINILNSLKRPHMFLNELKLYVEYLNQELTKNIKQETEKKKKQLSEFQENLIKGIEYYKDLFSQNIGKIGTQNPEWQNQLAMLELKVRQLAITQSSSV